MVQLLNTGSNGLFFSSLFLILCTLRLFNCLSRWEFYVTVKPILVFRTHDGHYQDLIFSGNTITHFAGNISWFFYFELHFFTFITVCFYELHLFELHLFELHLFELQCATLI